MLYCGAVSSIAVQACSFGVQALFGLDSAAAPI
jgi:hypothetical protein